MHTNPVYVAIRDAQEDLSAAMFYATTDLDAANRPAALDAIDNAIRTLTALRDLPADLQEV